MFMSGSLIASHRMYWQLDEVCETADHAHISEANAGIESVCVCVSVAHLSWMMSPM